MTCCPANKVPFEFTSKAKDASTQFKFISHKDGQSIVKCYPKTGRTHQIRVHLKSLGFPIANDQIYGGTIKNDGKMEIDETLF